MVHQEHPHESSSRDVSQVEATYAAGEGVRGPLKPSALAFFVSRNP